MISIIQISHSDWLPSGNPELKINLKTIIDESWTSLPLWEHLWKYLIGSKMTSLKLQRKSCLEISQVELLLHRTTVHFLAQYRPLWPGTRFKKRPFTFFYFTVLLFSGVGDLLLEHISVVQLKFLLADLPLNLLK